MPDPLGDSRQPHGGIPPHSLIFRKRTYMYVNVHTTANGFPFSEFKWATENILLRQQRSVQIVYTLLPLINIHLQSFKNL
jgi:hypothetical protein